ncbi:MAG: CapA family protein [Armatimonadetes bacterium]|nr:CapA family protein [Armatimonadota bacterium]
MASGPTAEIGLVGDVYVEREDPAGAIRAAAPYLAERFDLRFANLETTFSTRGKLKRSFPWASLRANPHNVAVLTAGKFDVVSIANNHTMDYGPDALMDTVALLDQHGIRYVGAGANWNRAWKMEVLEAHGVRVGFLAVEATQWTWIEHDAMPDRPGMAAVFVSPFFPDHVDGYRLRHLLETVERCRPQVDALVVSMHWGMSVSQQVCTYQSFVGRQLIDRGADVVVGTHPHTLQGVEVYRRRVICHSLGNFVFDSLLLPPESAVVGCTFSKRGLERAFLRPTTQADGQVHVLSPSEGRGRPIVETLQRLSADLDTYLKVDGDELVIIDRRGDE